MTKWMIITFVFCLVISACAAPEKTDKPAAIKAGSMDNKIKDLYQINDLPVTEVSFNKFLSTLKELPHTWFCAETAKGGRTGYDAADKKGVIYEVRFVSESENSVSSIRKKFVLK